MKPTPETDDSFGFLLHDVARLMRRNFNQRLQALGLTQAQCRALLHIGRFEGLQQVELAEILEITPITLARLIDRLEETGLVERRKDERDRRAFRLYLTGTARPLMTDIWALGKQTREAAIAGVDPTALHHFINTLQLIKQNLLGAQDPASDSSPTEILE